MRLGIFVGGASSRMGGSPKGRLPTGEDDEPLVVRLRRIAEEAGLDIVLVGGAEPYRDLLPDVPVIEDDPPAVGPLGGLSALLRTAPGRHVLAIACDMPFVTAPVLRMLRDHPSPAPVLAPRRRPEAPFEPLLARYDVARVRPVLDRALAEEVRSFQALFSRLEVEPLVPDAALAEALVDWDTPDDVRRSREAG